MQDIAGCRVVIATIVQQDRLVESLKTNFPRASVADRRENPSHGYRAVHVIAETHGKPIEIQVRSALQHLWAELSEKSADILDPTIKYGGGPELWREFLTVSATSVASYEKDELHYCGLMLLAEKIPNAKVPKNIEQSKKFKDFQKSLEGMNAAEVRQNLQHRRSEIADVLRWGISLLDDKESKKS
jgi:putative GTP pyrophosphokinase